MVKSDRKLKEKIESSLDSIEVPQSLIEFAKNVPYIIEETEEIIPRKKIKWKKAIISVSSIAAALLLIGNLSMTPAFSKMMEKIGVNWDFHMYSDDNGLKEASKHGIFESTTIEKNGITFSIDEVIADQKRCFLIYHISYDQGKYGDIEELWFDSFEVTDDKNRRIFKQVGMNTYFGKNVLPRIFQTPIKTDQDHTLYGYMEIINRNESDDLPRGLKISVKNIYESSYSAKKNNRKPVHFKGKWNIDLELDKSQISKEPKTFEGKQFSIQAGEKKLDLSVDYVKVYPTMTAMKFRLLTNIHPGIFYKYHLEDEKGNVYKHISDEILTDMGNTLPQFESFYFNEPKKLYLVIDEVTFSTYEKEVSYKLKEKIQIY